MILKYSDKRWQRIYGVIHFNLKDIIWFFVLAIVAYILYNILGIEEVALPIAPVSITGVGLAIFLGFRNSSAYDRWWEARKIWGGIVNTSRSWGMLSTSFIQPSEKMPKVEVDQLHKRLVYRHIAWLYALAMHLRKEMDTAVLKPFLDSEDLEKVNAFKNIPAQLVNLQSKDLETAWAKGTTTDFRHSDLNELLVELYTLQGKAERIKNTVFPYYYNFFTRVFLRLFLIILPFSLVDTMSWAYIPVSVAISFVFHILDKSGTITEEPFEGRASDTPMSTLCRVIEIDLRQMLGETELPAPREPKLTNFNAVYQD